MPLKHPRNVAVSLALAATLMAHLAGQAHASSTPAGAVFLNSASSTDSPSLRVDGAGGMHLAFAGYNTGINPGDDPSQPGYYAYCDPSADCSVAASWAQVALGTHVQAAQLQLTPAGQPRILLETADFASGDTASYWYAACDGGCTDPGNWLLLDLVDTTSIIGDVWNQPKHSFALDPQGRPRLLYSAGVLVYATCDTACTDTTTDPNSGQTLPANWLFAQISTGLTFNQVSLAFTSAGLPRAAGFGFNSSDFTFGLDYLECNGNCYDGSQWSITNLMPQGQAPLAVSLRLDGTDRVGLALSQSNQLWYWQCGAGCADPASWLWTRWDGLSGSVQDADLAFDAQNQPHLALRSSGGPFGWGLAEMACMASCTTADAVWTGEQLEDISRLSHDLPQLLPANCTVGGWFGDFRPSLALDPAGNLRVAFDNQFWVSGCSDDLDVRTQFEAVRVVYTGPALASSQARTAAAAAAAPSTAKQPIKLAASRGKGAMVGQHHPAHLLTKPGPRPSHTPLGGFGRAHQGPSRGHAPAPAGARRRSMAGASRGQATRPTPAQLGGGPTQPRIRATLSAAEGRNDGRRRAPLLLSRASQLRQ